VGFTPSKPVKLRGTGQPEQISELQDISIDMMSRTTLVYSSIAHETRNTETQIGLLSVESRNSKELLPSEVLHKVSVRNLLNLTNSVGLAEIGRFGKNSENVENTNEILGMLISSINLRGNVDYVIIEVDQARRRLWKRLGFKDIQIPENLKRSDFYQSGTDFLMYIPTKELAQRFDAY
jgi:hypothetical protein